MNIGPTRKGGSVAAFFVAFRSGNKELITCQILQLSPCLEKLQICSAYQTGPPVEGENPGVCVEKEPKKVGRF
jgi:hypothetical protein